MATELNTYKKLFKREGQTYIEITQILDLYNNNNNNNNYYYYYIFTFMQGIYNY
jgi:hypothetical protein